MGKYIVLLITAVLLSACGGSSSSEKEIIDDGSTGGNEPPTNSVQTTDLVVPSTYTFESRFNSGESSVSYTGQTKRHILIADLASAIGALSENPLIDVYADLTFYFDYDAELGDALNSLYSISGQTILPGSTYGDISSGKSLIGKIAGNDKAEHVLGDGFFGWETGLVNDAKPQQLVEYFFNQLDSLATDGVSEQIAVLGGATVDIDSVYVSAEGLDYKQLTQKFLLGAVTYSQGTTDYLKTEFNEVGLNTEPDKAGKPYSTAEHKWDEAFGYFGAARDYNDYTDDEIAGKAESDRGKGYFDTNADSDIDIRSEVNFGHSTNCAKRDRGAVIATDYTKTVFDAFLLGRTILHSADGDLSNTENSQLEAQALIISNTWEKCIAATVVHYINDVLADIYGWNGESYSDLADFKDYAKHWSELKGFSLGLQFNPDSPFRTNETILASLKSFHTLLGDAPVLADGTQNGVVFSGGVSGYIQNLNDAKVILSDAYQFELDNVENW